jgi:antitoxin VapB
LLILTLEQRLISQAAKIINTSPGQSVRLPKAFHFKGDEVQIKRIGSVVMLYQEGEGSDIMASTLGNADADFLADRRQPKKLEKRKRL